MAIRPLNSIAGFSTGDPAITVIQANADVTTINLTANGITNLGNVGNVHITGGSPGQYLATDGLGNLNWDSIGNLTSNRAAVMPYIIGDGQSYIVPENLQGLYAQTITIDGELEVDGMLIQIPISFQANTNEILFAENGNPTGRQNFSIEPISGNILMPADLTIKGNFLPYEDDLKDLGSPSKRWRNGYFGGNTLYLDTATISVNSDGFVVITNELGGQFTVAGNTAAGTSQLTNGNSNVIVNANGNVAFSVTGTSNVFVVTKTGANLNGNLRTTGNTTTGISALQAGATSTILPNTIASFAANVNSYTQVTLQNKNTGADATADYIVTADNGSDTVNYIDLGIINSGYDPLTPTNSLGNIVAAGDGYLYAQGNSSNPIQSGGSLAIGTTVPGKSVKVFAGGATNQYIVANISSTGVAVTGNVNVTANVIAGGVKTDNLYYSNGTPWDLQQPAGTSSQIQFNDNDNFGASANFTFDKTTNNLSVAGNIVSTVGVIYGNGSGLTQLTGANVTGTVPSATIAGTVTTAAQPNITSVGTLSALSVTGNVSAGGVKTDNIYYANGQPWDMQQPSGSNTQVQFNNDNNFGASANFTFDTDTNILQLLGTLKATNLDITGNGVIGGNLTVNGNLVYVNVEEFSVEDPIVNLNTGPNGVPPVANSGKDVGLALNYYDTQARIAFMGWDVSNAEFAFSSQSSISGEVVTYNTLGNVRAQTFIGNVNATTIAGNLTTATQSNITTVGTLGSLSVTANINAGNVVGANTISANYLISNTGCVMVGVGAIAVSAGTGGIFNSSVNDINLGLAANVTVGSTTGNTTIRGNLIVNNNVNVTGNVSAILVTGTLTTAAQPNITSVGNLTNLTVTGNTNSNTVTTSSTISKRSNIAVTTDTVIDSFDATLYRTAKYVIKSENDLGYESLEVLLIHNNINSYITVYAAINDGGGNTVAITTAISSGNVEVYATGLAANTIVNCIGTYVPD